MKMHVLGWALALVSTSAAFAGEYAIDGAHSSASFRIRHLVSKVTGGFNEFSGKFSFDEKNPKA